MRRSAEPRRLASSIMGSLLVLFLCFDFVSGPFHAHSHDVGADGLTSHVVHAADHGDRDSTHAEDFDDRVQGHSVAALVPAGMRVLEGTAGAGVLDSSYWLPMLAGIHAHEPATKRVWHVAWTVPAQTVDRHPLPEGRAPPSTDV